MASTLIEEINLTGPPLLSSEARDAAFPLRWETFADLHTLGPAYANVPIAIRLDRYRILGHDGLIWVLALTALRQELGLGPTYVFLPTAPRTLVFLREGLRFLDQFVLVGGLFVNEHVLWNSEIDELAEVFRVKQHAPEMSPIYMQRITSATYAPVLHAFHGFFVRDIAALLGESPTNDVIAQHSRPFQRAIAELITNIAAHAGGRASDGAGFACYHPFPRSHTRLRFCCADMGPGFRGTLAGKRTPHAINDDASAVLTGILYRLFYPQDGVVGLYNALDFIHSFRGSMKIRSGDALVEINLADQSARGIFESHNRDMRWVKRIARVQRRAPLRGVSIVLDLTLPSARDA